MRQDIEFQADGVTLRGWLYTPDAGGGPHATVVMSHGFSGVKEMDLDNYADVFCAGGLAVLVYDNRCLGASDGEPRHHIDPTWQRRDYRSAITYAQSRDEVDSERIGIWGTSYTGGTVCIVAAIDKRVKAVVSQVPFMNGHRNLQQFLPIAGVKPFRDMLDEDRARRVRGEPSQYMKMCSLDPNEPHVFPGEETYNYVHAFFDKVENLSWENRVTLASIEYMLEYDASAFMDQISPTPLMMILAANDTTTPGDIALDCYNKVAGPKELVVVNSTHYAAYTDAFEDTSAAARDWFLQHL